MTARCALIMAGGTGGHIFPGLAIAEGLRSRGWRVHWLGTTGSAGRPSMESQLVPPRGFAFESIAFSGVRGKGLMTFARLPARLSRAFLQSLSVLRRIRPDVVVGLGGYVAFPAGMMSRLVRAPLIVHEQNSVAGSANRLLAQVADRVFTAFPGVLKQAEWIGNPLRLPFLQQPLPRQRFDGRSGPLRMLVVGGSLGARVLNEVVPQALALLAPDRLPLVTHQSGEAQIDTLRVNYERAGVSATLLPFIDDTASAFADADVVLCRAGASTVTELAAVGAAAVFVPFAAAVDDHQSANARFLVDSGGGWLLPERDLTPQSLAALLAGLDRAQLLERATAAHALAKPGATEAVIAVCEELAA